MDTKFIGRSLFITVIWALLLFSIAIVPWGLFAPLEAQAATVRATVGNKCAPRGATNVEVPIAVSNVSSLGVIAVDIELRYDASRLDYASASLAGTIAESWGAPVVNSSTPGVLRMALYGVEDLVGAGKLVKVFFNVKTSAKFGTSILQLVRCRLNDGGTIETTLIHGSFTVTSGPRPYVCPTPPPGGYYPDPTPAPLEY